MIVTVTHPEIAEARLTSDQVRELSQGSVANGPRVVLQAEGLGTPHQWASELPTPADRIVVEYGVGRSRYERSWVLATETPAVRFYELAHDSSSSGYVTR